ncbi:MAG: GGDEF domain-containing protein [Candidatus Omnitrophica bacterium]|nr:GGDEF domain-containing protein [Candidatus Omnitrophota bacterium]
MNHAMILIAFFYVGFVFMVTRRITRDLIQDIDEEMLEQNQVYRKPAQEHLQLQAQRKKLEEQAETMFALYDMTREINKSFDESSARAVLETKLNEHRKDSDPDLKNILNQQFALALRRIQLYQEVERLAMMDSLTQVYTRRYILERLEEEGQRVLSRQASLSFLMIDVDYFKNYNDQHGHLVGDQLLREITRIIQENVREIDMVGRYGGEEFCVILPDTGQEDAYLVAERIRQAMESQAIKVYDLSLTATVSIGIATLLIHAQKVSDLIERADHALYEAKGLGRNKVIFARKFH